MAAGQSREMLAADQLTLDVIGNLCNLRIIFQNIQTTYDSGNSDGIDYSMFIMIAVSPGR